MLASCVRAGLSLWAVLAVLLLASCVRAGFEAWGVLDGAGLDRSSKDGGTDARDTGASDAAVPERRSGEATPPTCGMGSYLAAGAGSCTTCPAGSYCPGDNTAIPCVAGTYQPSTGQSSCVDSGPGYYVGAAGATARTICTAGGFYCPNAINTGATACGAGHYTDTGRAAGATSCSTCTADRYCTGDGSRSTCPGGMGAPPGSDSSADCGCHVRLTICAPDCSNFPTGCSNGSTQWMTGAKPGDSYCVPDSTWGHGRETVDCTY